VNSTTLLALAGIGGTLLATVIGTAGSLGQTSMARRADAAAEDQKARRTAYAACATVLMARRDSVSALRELFLAEDPDLAAANLLAAESTSLRPDVARAVAAVMVEGPEAVAHWAELAAHEVESAVGRYRNWLTDVAGGQDLDELRLSQMQFATEDHASMELAMARFLGQCRKTLHPGNPGAVPVRGRRYRWRRSRSG
jgi:hypothetical protein